MSEGTKRLLIYIGGILTGLAVTAVPTMMDLAKEGKGFAKIKDGFKDVAAEMARPKRRVK